MRQALRRSLAATAVLTLALGAARAASAQGPVSGHVSPSGEYDQERLGAGGLQKCTAYRKVRQHSDEMQAADHGVLSPGDTHRLMVELKQAKHMAPRKLTPADCGVPL